MAAPRKYGDELRERATRMAVEARQDPATTTDDAKRLAELEREVRELKRANEMAESTGVRVLPHVSLSVRPDV